MDTRLASLSKWLTDDLKLLVTSINPASADASFRRYFRVTIEEQPKLLRKQLPSTFIVMDSPPEHEDNMLFSRCTETLSQCGLNVPTIFEANFSQGFLILKDLGTEVYQHALTPETADVLYNDAMQALLLMQASTPKQDIASYNASKIKEEMQLFEDWYIGKYHQSCLSKDEQNSLKSIIEILTKNALEQPQVLVHRDYHCRNLLVSSENNPGVIDYQDMVIGPITYDLVSIFKDCYIEWPTASIQHWSKQFQQKSLALGIHQVKDTELWQRWFDWMGAQRHLKVLGIFSRLFFRDGKDQYLGDLPLTYQYLLNTSKQYKELNPLADILRRYPVKTS